jgi:hypothetical protein
VRTRYQNGNSKVTALLLFDEARAGWRQRYKPQKGKITTTEGKSP